MISAMTMRRALFWSVVVAAGLGASPVNIAPDAVTSATLGYNPHEGELASLTDGLHPGNSQDAKAFVWPTKGNLVFQFEEVHPVAAVRLYIGGDAGWYMALAYQGARLGPSGQTETADAELVADAYDFEEQTNTWVELAFPSGTEADYIEVGTQSGAVIYEVEILSDDGTTAVAGTSWGRLKASRP
ncbi:MAG: hypothetical protein WDA75_12645 [Candidatus Latescibacterota bacterium]|jgi:hypothetical protein